MIADTLALPHCIRSTAELKSISLAVVGSKSSVIEWIREVSGISDQLEFSASQKDKRGKITITVRMAAETPYKVIGCLIYSAQLRRLRIGPWMYHPPFCGPVPQLP